MQVVNQSLLWWRRHNLSEVANELSLVASMLKLGVLPSVLVEIFVVHWKSRRAPRIAARILKEGKRRRMDVGRVAYIGKSGKEETRYFVGVASFACPEK